jgi:hypothetical protein
VSASGQLWSIPCPGAYVYILSMECRVPLQRYNVSLLRQGRERGALVVLMRSLRAWRDNMPELADYPHFVASNPRSARISRANLPTGYPVIPQRLAAR